MTKHDKDYFKKLGKLLDEHAPPVYSEPPEEIGFYIKWMNLQKKKNSSLQNLKDSDGNNISSLITKP